MKVFKLPDLGEGLPDAEIVEWLVEEGDEVKLDQPLVSMETAKAVVEVPSPFSGKVAKFHGQAGDVIQTGAPLAEFQVEGESDDLPEPEPEPASAEPEAAEPQAGAEPHTSRAEPSPEPSGRDAVEDVQPEPEEQDRAPSDERADTGT
ncbi:MAG: biotin/lipoyl-containing protein, partial [Wenzhouxiangella sp.]